MITTTIASAVDEQGAATAEIARNVQQTASRTAPGDGKHWPVSTRPRVKPARLRGKCCRLPAIYPGRQIA